ncbi:PAAR domain-containing protein [Acinetobacter sp. WZC-1]|uniref:PAAR domain-containing protein n=1 Tax=Acinetobacter sp. WZC-1 TaxID=3459034 RepID=UPI00403DCBE0
MVKGFAIHNSMTTHGGIIQATQQRASQMGNLFLRAGDGHYCPQCKCWSTIQPSHNHIIMYGQPVAYVNDLLSCGARILPQQSHVVGDSQGSNYSSTSATPMTSLQNSLVETSSEEIHKIQFKIVDEDTEEGISEMLYEIYSKDTGSLLVRGYTDKQGMTALYESEYSPESVQLITVDLSKPLEEL